MTPIKIYINGWFLKRGLTGTSRVAQEILGQWNTWLSQDRDLRARVEIAILQPDNDCRRLHLHHIPQRVCNVAGGKIWQLVDLPIAARDGVLVGFANLGPVLHPRSVLYMHDAHPFEPLAPMRWKTRTKLKALMKLAALGAREIITVSEYSAGRLAHAGLAKANRITVVHNGADHLQRGNDAATDLSVLGLIPHTYVMMFDSGFAYKNAAVVFAAMQRLAGQNVTLALIARAAPQGKNLGLQDIPQEQVRILRGLDDKTLAGVYRNALAFLQPSRMEGAATAVMEAVMAGAPALTADIPVMREELFDGAWYLSADAPEAWAEAIIRLAANPQERISLLQRGQTVVSRYTWATAAAAVWGVVDKTIGGRLGPAPIEALATAAE